MRVAKCRRMRTSHLPLVCLLILLATLSVVSAQPADIWVRHDADSSRDTIAPGALFSVGIMGPLGPLPTEAAGAFPLRTSLAGVTLRITIARTVTNAFVLSTEAYKVRALLPSTTPTGEGELQMTINGRSYGFCCELWRWREAVAVQVR
jgi:hypothetical protein